jgi:predicted AlkP superfamily pyrophosphatase or phosphodiesterase
MQEDSRKSPLSGAKIVKPNRVVVIDVVGLSPKHFKSPDCMPNLASLLNQGSLFTMKPVFPAVTLPVQASLTTGVYPETHGVVANGFYFPDNFQVAFWEQAARLVQHERIWDRVKRRNPELKTAVLFFQNTLYSTADAIITPKPLHSEEGLIQWCYSKPVGLYEEICEQIGEFNLFHFWGPMASIESSRWIAKASIEVMARFQPHLMFVYLPHLDYCSQKYGPQDPKILEELRKVDQEVGRVVQGMEDLGLKDETIFIVLSEYVFYDVEGDVPLNRFLREEGLLEVPTIHGREYLDMELSPAFAMVDHQIAHIYMKPGYIENVKRVLKEAGGLDLLLDAELKQEYRVDHPRSGDLIAVSSRNRWFSYYWWDDRSREPDFATHVDIHRKPGYDPLELFVEPGTFKISQDTSLIRGSHGYPPLSGEDCVPLLITSESAGNVNSPENLCITDVSGVIEEILTASR